MSLDRVNDAFHGSYDDQRAVAESDPILVVLADDLVLFRGKERATFHVTTAELTNAKQVAHAPVALWLLLQHPPSPTREARIAELRAHIESSPADAILSETLKWIDRMPFDLDTFAAAFGEPLMDAIGRATTMQLEALHRTTEEVLATMSANERGRLHVAVTGDHQARIRSLPMQYFQKRFVDIDRVLYAEGVTSASEAAALVGKQRLDRAMAKAFFGNPRRMQRDLLGDVAKAELAKADFERIDRER